MHLHLIPYEQVFLSVTLSMDEATAVSDALSLVASRNNNLNGPAEKLKELLESGIERAAQLQDRRTK